MLHLPAWLALPPPDPLAFDPEARALRSSLQRSWTWMGVAIGAACLFHAALGQAPARSAAIFLIHSAAVALVWLMARAGQPRRAALAYFAGFMTMANLFAASAGGVATPGIDAQLAPLAACAILLGGRPTLALAALGAAEACLLFFLGQFGLLPAAPEFPLARHLSVALANIAFVAAFSFAAARHVGSVLSEAREAGGAFQAAFERSPLAQIVIGIDRSHGDALFAHRANAAFAKLSGGHSQALPALILGSDPPTADYIARVCEAGEELRGFEMGFVDANGVARAVELSMTPIAWRGERASLCAIVDRSEEISQERSLREVNATLEAGSALRAAELTKARRELQAQERLASLGSMVAGVAHELNTPIGNARLTASTLAESAHATRERAAAGTLRKSDLERHFERTAEASALLVSSLERAGDLVAQFKQISADRSSSARRPFSLAALARDTLAMHGPALKASKARVSAEVSCDEEVRMDSFPGPLGQVISNFLNNSLLHAFEARAEGRIHIHIWTETDSAVLRYWDDGVGIAPSALPRVFDPFYTTKLGQGGTGLGMYVAHNIVCDLLGGSIKIESPQGTGVALTLRLPLRAPDGGPKTPALTS